MKRTVDKSHDASSQRWGRELENSDYWVCYDRIAALLSYKISLSPVLLRTWKWWNYTTWRTIQKQECRWLERTHLMSKLHQTCLCIPHLYTSPNFSESSPILLEHRMWKCRGCFCRQSWQWSCFCQAFFPLSLLSNEPPFDLFDLCPSFSLYHSICSMEVPNFVAQDLDQYCKVDQRPGLIQGASTYFDTRSPC